MKQRENLRARELFFVELLGSLTILFTWIISLYFLKDAPGYKTFVKILSYTFLVYVSFSILVEEVLIRFIKTKLLLIFNIFIFTLILEGISIATGIPFNRLNYLLIFPVILSAYFLGAMAGIAFSILSILLFSISHIYILHQSHNLQDILFYGFIFLFSHLLLIAIAVYTRENVRKARERLKKVELSKERILESIPSGVLVLDKDNHMVYINPHAANILTKDELSKFIEQINMDSNSRKEININGKIIGYSGRTLPDNEKIIIFQDVTQIKRLEKERELNKKLIALGEMSAQLAHEIRNPLTSIITASELMKDLNSNKGLLIEKITEGAERLNRLITEFLSFTRITGIRKQKIDIGKLLKDVIERFKWQYPSIEFKHEIENSLITYADGNLFNSVFENILQNAVDALKESPEKKIAICMAKENGKIHIKIQDTGEGMEKDKIEHIFDPFFTTKTYGTGLGLSLVRKILSYHNAEIKINSIRGKGTIVKIIIPIENHEEQV